MAMLNNQMVNYPWLGMVNVPPTVESGFNFFFMSALQEISRASFGPLMQCFLPSAPLSKFNFGRIFPGRIRIIKIFPEPGML